MLKLKLDWANESEQAPEGVDADDELVRVELTGERPAGWPEIAVYVAREAGEPAHMAYMRLDGWLADVYGEQDEDMRQELADGAEEV